jgi:D-amino peptidase
LTVRVQTQTPALADLFCQWPSLRRLASDEVGFDAPTVEAAVRIVNCLSAMSSLLR